MMSSKPILLPVLATLLLAEGVAASSIAAVSQEDGTDAESNSWNFQVFVDDKVVGTHRFELREIAGQQHLTSVADFQYKWSFVTLYQYQHQNQETWKGGCLERIESTTDANGKDYSVLGNQKDEGFLVEGSKGQKLLPACVMSFAYWNKDFLLESKLLNTQNGDYMDVLVSGPVQENLQMFGEGVKTQRYRLTAGKLDLELWYSESGNWLALQSRTEKGNVLRYQLLADSWEESTYEAEPKVAQR